MKTIIDLTTVNFTKGRGKRHIEYIVVHNTGNNGDTDTGNANFFKVVHPAHPASAHDFIDEDSVTHIISYDDTAWHCGDKHLTVPKGGAKWKGKVFNQNSIGVELCSDIINGELSINAATLANGAEWVNHLMHAFKIDINHVVRHFDVTGKDCPHMFVKHPETWEAFKLDVARRG